MALRRKYKINEEDLDQIPGKNRKRKKKKPSPAVRESSSSSGRSAGSGPKIKELNRDLYDERICALCLAPMVPVLPHSNNKPAVSISAVNDELTASMVKTILESEINSSVNSNASGRDVAKSSSSNSSAAEVGLNMLIPSSIPAGNASTITAGFTLSVRESDIWLLSPYWKTIFLLPPVLVGKVVTRFVSFKTSVSRLPFENSLRLPEALEAPENAMLSFRLHKTISLVGLRMATAGGISSSGK